MHMDPNCRTLVAELPRPLYRTLKHHAFDHDTTIRKVLIEALTAYLGQGNVRRAIKADADRAVASQAK